jgi:hypothetical protein
MSHPIKRFVLTPSEAAAKALLVEQIRMAPHGPWVNGKKTILPKSKGTVPASKSKE